MSISALVEATGFLLDLAGALLIVIGLAAAGVRYLFAVVNRAEASYRAFRQDIGRAILLGLEVLVAADIIRTVAITPTLTSVAVLGGIVAIRTFLSMSIQIELEGKLPWRR